MSIGTVLVVDDDPTIRKSLRRVLETRQYSVFEASNGKEALDLLSGVDLIILDMQMPEMNGEEFLSELKKVEYPPAVIVVTAGSSEKDALIAGSVDFIQKPFNFTTILAKIDNHVLMRKSLDKRAIDNVTLLTYTACHNINQPLTVILGYSDILKNNEDLPENVRKAVNKIADSGDKIKSIIEELSRLVKTGKFRCEEFSGVKLIDIKKNTDAV